MDKELLYEAAEHLRSMAYNAYETYTANSCTDRRHWTYDEKCRYGDKFACEIADKLLEEYNRDE